MIKIFEIKYCLQSARKAKRNLAPWDIVSSDLVKVVSVSVSLEKSQNQSLANS